MLPDQKLGAGDSAPRAESADPGTGPRGGLARESTREVVAYEVLVAWSHVAKTPVRYRALDVSAGGMRIRSMLPIREGLRGTVLSTLPHGVTANRPFKILWCKKVTTEDGSGVAYEAGLRFES
ncbi:MAG: PilZ domain-containing protein [Phycisphaerae bacterium]|nr:PilZ domain-containing protein [Phycisphaerae bacterium]